MQFTTTLSLLSALSLAAALPNSLPTQASATYVNTPTTTLSSDSNPSGTAISTICPVSQEGDYVWKISDFSARKLNGTDNNAVSFNIKATNNGTLDFQCGSSAEHDSVLEEGTLYSCGENSFISFAFQGTGLTSTRLLLKQDVSDDDSEVGTTTVPYYCHAGGSGPNDFVCQGVSDAYITLAKLPSQQ